MAGVLQVGVGGLDVDKVHLNLENEGERNENFAKKTINPTLQKRNFSQGYLQRSKAGQSTQQSSFRDFFYQYFELKCESIEFSLLVWLYFLLWCSFFLQLQFSLDKIFLFSICVLMVCVDRCCYLSRRTVFLTA